MRPLERLLAQARCPVLIITSNPALIRQTRIGKFVLAARESDETSGPLRQWIKKLRPQGGAGEARRQLAVLRNLSRVLRLIPGKARDLYTYIVAHQYWTNASPENLYRLICLLIEGYVPGYKGKLPILDPVSYPEQALVHPDAPGPFESLAEYERWRAARARGGKGVSGAGSAGVVGILALRTVVLSGNTAHLDALVGRWRRRAWRHVWPMRQVWTCVRQSRRSLPPRRRAVGRRAMRRAARRWICWSTLRVSHWSAALPRADRPMPVQPWRRLMWAIWRRCRWRSSVWKTGAPIGAGWRRCKRP